MARTQARTRRNHHFAISDVRPSGSHSFPWHHRPRDRHVRKTRVCECCGDHGIGPLRQWCARHNSRRRATYMPARGARTKTYIVGDRKDHGVGDRGTSGVSSADSIAIKLSDIGGRKWGLRADILRYHPARSFHERDVKRLHVLDASHHCGTMRGEAP